MAVGYSLSTLVAFSLLILCFADVEPQTDQPHVINVSRSSCQDALPGLGGNCTELDSALDQLSSDVTIMLEQGTHSINRSHLMDIRGASNIKVIGAGADVTVITCADQNGLPFVGVTNLTLVNFTLTNCGLSGSNMDYHITLLREVLDLWYMIPPTTKIALFLGHCTNVMIEDVNITDTAGLGFLGINILGTSSIKQSGFTNNIRPKCLNELPPISQPLIDPDIYDQVGGGAFILYADIFNSSSIESDHKLLLSELYFSHNADCTFAANTIMNFPYCTEGLTNRALYNYSIGAGGGLSLILSNRDFSVAVDVYDSIFYQNAARYGSGAFVATFAGFQNPLNVTFNGCTFIENGLTATHNNNETHTCCKGGGGLAIFTDLLKPNIFLNGVPTSHVQFIFQMFTTEFVNNAAQVQGGGIFAYSLLKTQQQVSCVNGTKKFYSIVWSFMNINFTNNSAPYGSVGFYDQISDFSFDGLALLRLANITARKNYNQIKRSSHITDGSTLHMKNIVCEFKDMTLEYNVGSALHLDSTVAFIQPSARLIFHGNTAHRGGAMYLSGHSPALIVDTNCSLHFEENAAHTEGGAIYYSQPDLSGDILKSFSLMDCFLLTPSPSAKLSEHFDIFNLGINLLFRNNQAPIGSTIFGSLLQCSWAKKLMSSSSGENLSLYSKLYRDYNSTFSFDHDPINEQFISTPPASISVITGTEQPIEAYPGQALPIEIKVLDIYNNTIPAIVTSDVNTVHKTRTKSYLRESGFWYTDNANTTLSVVGALNESVSISIFTSSSSVSTTVSINLLSCPIGFEMNQENLRCSCSDYFLIQSRITCDPKSISFQVFGNYWLGVDPAITESTSEDLFLSECVFNYCRSNRNKNKTVLPFQIDAQCNFNRTGILCGSCNREEGYSSVLGSNECHKCSNHMLFLIIVFAIAGAVLFSGIFFLEITIDKGWTNSVIFFFRIVIIYDYLILKSDYKYALLPAHLLNLQIGVSLCFYDGMTGLSRAGLQLVFPTYLYMLMAVFTILCRHYSWMSTHFSPTKTLMTLSVICYASVLTTCVELVGLVRIETFGGMNTSYRWYNDPNQVYFQGWHAFLCAIGIAIIVIYIIPFPILLLFPNLAYKYLARFTPLFDALWAAYKPKYRFWLGLRLMSVVFLLASTRLPGQYGITISGLYAVIFFQLQGVIQPFKDKVANRADTVFLTIALLFYWGNLCALALIFNDKASTILYLFLSALITFFYLASLLLCALHLHHKFPCLWQKFHSWLVVCFEHLCNKRGGEDQTEPRNISTENDQCHTTTVNPPIHHTEMSVASHHTSNQQFRESILDMD